MLGGVCIYIIYIYLEPFDDPCFDLSLDLLLEAKPRTNGFQVYIYIHMVGSC